MSRPRKYNLPPPPPTTVPPSPAEIIEAPGKLDRPPGTPVELVSAGPPLDILVGRPVPRVQLVIVLRVDPGADPAAVALAAARFVSDLQAADRKLRLAVDPAQSRAAGGEVTLVLTPASLGVETAGRLEKLVGVVREAAAAFAGATLSKVEVTPRA
jgi:hypothetical protein